MTILKNFKDKQIRSCKKSKRKNEFEFKEQKMWKIFFIKEQDEMMKEFWEWKNSWCLWIRFKEDLKRLEE
jgi:hypothetical protein